MNKSEEREKREQVGNKELSASGMKGYVDILGKNIWVHDSPNYIRLAGDPHPSPLQSISKLVFVSRVPGETFHLIP